MKDTRNNIEVYNVVASSLWEMLQGVQEGIKQGYVLSDDNLHFPQAFISLFTVTLVKPNTLVLIQQFNNEAENVVNILEEVSKDCEKVAEDATIDAVPNQVKKTAGRPPKVQK